MERESNLAGAYLDAYKAACAKLPGREPEEVCQNSKAVYERETQSYVIPYFGQSYRVRRGDGKVSLHEAFAESEEAAAGLPVTEQLLILHYLIHAQPKALSGRSISFKEVPNGGAIYYPTFKKRAIDPLVGAFSGDFPGFAKASAALCGSAESLGDAAVTLYAFPFVPITYVIWRGDEEVSAAGTVLFAASVAHFLPVEDIVVAAGLGVYKLIKARSKP
jgi:hypothetical protein